MRLPLALCLALLSLAGGVTPIAAAPRQRTESASYAEPTRGHPDVAAVCFPDEAKGCVEFGVGPRDRRVSIEVVDDSGTPTNFLLRQELGGKIEDRLFCGSTEGFVPIRPNGRITVYIHVGPSSTNLCPGVGTSGVVNATFASR